MMKRKIISLLIALLVIVNSAQSVGAAAYTVSGNTATAIEGTTSWVPSGGVGNATVDLKNGTLIFDGVQLNQTSLGGQHSNQRSLDWTDYTITSRTLPTAFEDKAIPSNPDDLYTIRGRDSSQNQHGTVSNYGVFINYTTSRVPYAEFDVQHDRVSEVQSYKNYGLPEFFYYDDAPDNFSSKQATSSTSDTRIISYAGSAGINRLGFVGRIPVYRFSDTSQSFNTEKPIFSTNNCTITVESYQDGWYNAAEPFQYDNIDVLYGTENTGVTIDQRYAPLSGGGTYAWFYINDSNITVNYPEFSKIGEGSNPDTLSLLVTRKTLEGKYITEIQSESKAITNVPQVSNVVGAKQINDITLKNCSSNNGSLPLGSNSTFHTVV